MKSYRIMGAVFVFVFLLTFAGCNCAHKKSVIPSAYDLRDHGLITSVKNQMGLNPNGSSDINSTVGLCWAFASLNTLESNMLKQGIVNSPDDPSANLSPWYLGNYIRYNTPSYTFNNNSLPGTEPPLVLSYTSDTGGWGGGGGFWVADYLVAGKGLPLWQDSPIPTELMSQRLPLTKPVTNLLKQYTIKDMEMYFRENFSSDAEFADAVKRYILKNGSIQSMIHLEPIDTDGINEETCEGIRFNAPRFMDKINNNMYTYNTNSLCTALYTHAVSIAGWDDNRQINVNGHITKGAWLIKDSTGPRSHNKGYFWVAYDDQVHLKLFASGIIAQKDGIYKHPSTYQTHTGLLTKTDPDQTFVGNTIIQLGEYNYIFNGSLDTESWGFADFKIDVDEKLKAIAIFTSNRNEHVTVNIYKDSKDSELLYSKPFDVSEIGYHLLNLGKEISFKAGDTIVIGTGFAHNPNHDRLPLLYVQDEDYNFTYPTYFGTSKNGVYDLMPYSDFCSNCSLYMQAVMAE